MRDIYAQAQRVYVDLGNVHPGRFTGLSLMKRAAFITELTDRNDPSLEIDEHILPPWDDFRWIAYWHLFTSPWFTRSWVVQELCLAREAKFMFGRFVFSMMELEKSFSMLRPHAARTFAENNVLTKGILNFLKLQSVRDGFLSRRLSSLGLLQLTRDFNCTEPKDKVFSLSALMKRNDQIAIGHYGASVVTVYTRFAALQFMYGLQILDHAGLQRRGLNESALPTWAPDWTEQDLTTGPRIISSLRNVPYDASAWLIPRIAYFSPKNFPRQIGLGGLVLDTLRHVGDIIRPPEGTSTEFLLQHDKVREAFDDDQNLLSSIYDDPELALVRTLLMDDDYTGRNAVERCEPIINPLESYHQVLDKLKTERNDNSSWFMQIGPTQTYWMQTMTATASRRFSITKKGYMGLVSPAAKVGDVVAILFGASVPYILRSAEDKFLLVGDAYIHGVMYGETLNQDFEAREIILV